MKNIASLAAIASAALFAGALTLITPEAKAEYYSCNSIGSYTSCYGSDGSSYSGSTIGGYTSGYYYDGNGNSSYQSCTTIGGYTSCSSY